MINFWLVDDGFMGGMTWTRRLQDVTDERTIERGHVYATAGRVVSLREQGGRVSATARGTQTYRVELTADTWWCDCPVGSTGAFCKHCVAVAIEAARIVEDDDGDVELEVHADEQVPLADSGDLDVLKAEVAATFTPRRRSYDYRQANSYADDVESLVRLIEGRSRELTSVEFLRIVQRAVELTVRTILRSDDSSGLQGMQIDRLLDVHLRVAGHSSLSKMEAKKTARWLAKYELGETRDVVHVNIDEYAPALGQAGLGEYRRRLDAVAEREPGGFTVRHAHGRLIILGGDVDEIVAHFGGPLDRAHDFIEVVQALEAAGHNDIAGAYARQALEVDPGWPLIGPIVERVVKDARARGAVDELLASRRRHFEHAPSVTTYVSLERDARAVGAWTEAERLAAGSRLAGVDPRGWVNLLHEKREDELAWTAAQESSGRVGVELWTKLLRRRVSVDPAETLPYYRQFVDDVLVTADQQNYRTAARLLRDMSTAADAAGQSTEYREFLNGVLERNRRRPRFFDELRRVGVVA